VQLRSGLTVCRYCASSYWHVPVGDLGTAQCGRDAQSHADDAADSAANVSRKAFRRLTRMSVYFGFIFTSGAGSVRTVEFFS